MNSFCPKTNQPEQDVVYTPDEMAIEIVRHFNPSGRILEPCKGGGSFLRALPSDTAWCEIEEGIDFLMHNGSYDWIMTNPPWSKIRQFLTHAIALSATNIVFLMNINALMTKKRLKLIHDNGYSIKEFLCFDNPPPPWPQVGFQLAAIHIAIGNFYTKWSYAKTK